MSLSYLTGGHAVDLERDTEGTPRAPSQPLPLAVVADRITEISSLPDVALRVMEIASDPESGLHMLKRVVEADVSLCARVLRCVNSATFGLRREIADVGQAVSYLGFNQVRDLAITATVCELFKKAPHVGTYDRGGLWRHLVAVGVVARMIAIRRKVAGFESAFLCGLLHDMGIILFDQSAHAAFRAVIRRLHANATLADVEQSVVGWDHMQLGHEVGSRWKLPRSVLEAIAHHHDPQRYAGPHQELVHSVSVANVLCSIHGISSVGLNLVGLAGESLVALDLDRSDLKILAGDLDAELNRHQHLFDIQGN